MKTLELKHVAPYLAYGLKGITYGYNKDKRISELQGVSFDSFVYEPELFIETKLTNITSRRRISISNFKPILRPLSQLPQDEKTCAEINLLLEPNGLEINNFLLLRNSILNVAISWQEMQEVLNILYREHYDVFGLIEQKLAIEKL